MLSWEATRGIALHMHRALHQAYMSYSLNSSQKGVLQGIIKGTGIRRVLLRGILGV